MSGVGVVVIGRNEGERLKVCLRSILPSSVPTVYVDSGSTDGSQAAARELGAQVVELDLSQPFTAARARNAGFAKLLADHPDLEFVQFVDGDCELHPGWLEAGVARLREELKLAIVFGRLRERFPEKSIYNRLCDMEWNVPAGEVESSGGNALIRIVPFRDSQGYREELIAGEEPELCLRLRQAGWKIERIDAEMGLHDAAMTRFRQWWKRAVRAGHAYAEVSHLHRRDPINIWKREVRSNWFWGLFIPVLALGLIPFTLGFSALLFLVYPLQGLRIWRKEKAKKVPAPAAFALFCVLAKFPMMLGQLRFQFNRLFRRRSTIIEYK